MAQRRRLLRKLHRVLQLHGLHRVLELYRVLRRRLRELLRLLRLRRLFARRVFGLRHSGAALRADVQLPRLHWFIVLRVVVLWLRLRVGVW